MDLTPAESLLTNRIREAGLRLTLPRRAICRILANSEEEFLTASMVLKDVIENMGQIDASTVYRTLDELARIGLVHHVHLGPGQPGKWHLTTDHDHQHLVCENCGKTIDVPETDLAPMYELLRTRYGFHSHGHHMALFGFCDECADLPSAQDASDVVQA